MAEQFFYYNVLNQARARQETINQTKIAVLIDAENVSPTNIDKIFNEIAKYGSASIRRIYGDWTSQQMSSWRESLNRHSLQPKQSFRYTNGKNSTDSALIIDAMDILYAGKSDAFALVSSDSDFTHLASRIRESGLYVYGFGEEKTPEAFVKACNQFTYVEILGAKENFTDKKRKAKSEIGNRELVDSSVKDAANESGRALLSQIGIILRNKQPSFDYRSYGYANLAEMLKQMGYTVENNEQNVSYVQIYWR